MIRLNNLNKYNVKLNYFFQDVGKSFFEIWYFLRFKNSKLKAGLHIPFTHVENACILSTIGTYIQAVKANPRLILSKQGKNVPQYVAFSFENFLFKIKIACSKKLKRDVPMSLQETLKNNCLLRSQWQI